MSGAWGVVVRLGGRVPISRSRRSRVQRPRMSVELAPVVERRLGALPASAEFLRRLDVAGIIDELCPVREVAHLTHGQVIEALVANRLSSPALDGAGGGLGARRGRWRRSSASSRTCSTTTASPAPWTPSPRAWRRSPARSARRRSREFGIDVAQIHWDMTSISCSAPMTDQDEEYPQVKYGHPKDRRVDLKQVQAGLAVTRDGGIPSSTGSSTAGRARSPRSSAR